MSRGLKCTKKASWHNGKFKRELIQNDPPHLRSKGVEFFMSIFDIKMSHRHKNVRTTHFPSMMYEGASRENQGNKTLESLEDR